MTLIFAMCLFAFTMSITPGPVNMVILTSGLKHGVRRTIPFVAGSTIGFIALLGMIGLGLGAILSGLPVFEDVLAVAGSVFIAYLGWQIMHSDSEMKADDQQCPGFWQGALLQWLNPKAWIACMSGISAFALHDEYGKLGVFLLLYFTICLLTQLSWAIVGSKISIFLSDDHWRKFINRVMGGSLIAIAAYLVFTHFL
ncbi:lysine transporter LysE [Veronia nyctiphanis]|uniref:Lysine transporter LysE n=1 Tax=Veronia nyctiphanis TaxID=1278244 RepID=A0A4Q0YUI7_9GAMM|nr:LysE family translocator [Veronia nyctiphanis]RXJ74930.1 lysine transporter LysE [Veronia nyctiphanis]